jgi:peroxiredoxin
MSEPKVKVGDKVPDAKLFESDPTGYDEGNNCPLRPQAVQVADLVKGKRTVICGVPGAFTPTCSANHVPGYMEHYDELKNKGVEQICFVAVNDGWVMREWAKSQKAEGKIRFLGDGDAEFAKALGLDFACPGMGTRNRRFSMLVSKDGVIEQLNVETKGFEVSDAKSMLAKL